MAQAQDTWRRISTELDAALEPSPVWEASYMYRQLIQAERGGKHIDMLGFTGLSGVLRTSELTWATSTTFREGQLRRAEHQLRLMDARRRVVDWRVAQGELQMGIIMPADWMKECADYPETLSGQVLRLREAVDRGWSIRTLPRSSLQTIADPAWRSAILVDGGEGASSGVYIERIPPAEPHETWSGDPEVIAAHKALHACLNAISEPIVVG
jgi:uncharacterized protein DUF5753